MEESPFKATDGYELYNALPEGIRGERGIAVFKGTITKIPLQ